MPKFYHVTKLSRVRDIKGVGLKPSSGIGAGGMSSDSSEAYKYADQDKDLVYLWTDEEYTDKFKKSGQQYAMLIVNVEQPFVTNCMGPSPFKGKIGDEIPGDATTAVCNTTIPLENLFYKKEETGEEFPLTEWGVFSMELDKSDTRIWGGFDID